MLSSASDAPSSDGSGAGLVTGRVTDGDLEGVRSMTMSEGLGALRGWLVVPVAGDLALRLPVTLLSKVAYASEIDVETVAIVNGLLSNDAVGGGAAGMAVACFGRRGRPIVPIGFRAVGGTEGVSDRAAMGAGLADTLGVDGRDWSDDGALGPVSFPPKTVYIQTLSLKRIL